jgi:hypothetical protein
MAAAMYPMMKDAIEKAQKEGGQVKGTALASTTRFEGVKSKAQMEQAASQKPESGGGIGGMLARKMSKPKPVEPRSTIFTATHEVLSIAPSAADSDVAVPAGYKDKTKK